MSTPKLLGYMALDQYNQTHHLREPKHPRKQLLALLDAKKAVPMYCDTKDGRTKQTGWIIRGRWLTVYGVREFDGLNPS